MILTNIFNFFNKSYTPRKFQLFGQNELSGEKKNTHMFHHSSADSYQTVKLDFFNETPQDKCLPV